MKGGKMTTDKMLKDNNFVKCHDCAYFFVTHRAQKPYGCKAYGFISKYIPSLVVFQTSGIKCAYKKIKTIEYGEYGQKLSKKVTKYTKSGEVKKQRTKKYSQKRWE